MSESGGGPSDEMVSQFLAFTGSADPATATSYLEMSGGDVETAVGLFLEHQGGGGGGGMGGGNNNATSTGAGADMDAATAAAVAAAQNDPGFGSPEVRAPDQTQTMRLMDDGPLASMHAAAGGIPPGLLGALEEANMITNAFAAPSGIDARGAVNTAAANLERRRSRTASGGGSGGGNDDDDDDDDDYKYDDDDDNDDDDDSDADAGGVQAPTLEDMFAPPNDLIYRAGGFQGARNAAKESRRWLLVNLQRDSEFSCHALNRDVWRHDLVENLIREGFIFWQCYDVHPDGQTYAQRYGVLDYPHVAIIDPRTGRSMWKKEGWTQQNPMTAETFAEMAMDFCSRHSFDKPPQVPRQSGASSSTTNGSTNESRPTKRPYMTEDEELQAAMAASLQDDKDDNNGGVDVTMDEGGGENEDGNQIDQKEEPKEPEAPSFIDELVAYDVGDEPAGDGARVQIRMPDGKRLVRKFSKDSTLKVIYAFVAQNNEEAKGGKEFILMAGYPPCDLLPDIESSIESRGLSGGAITVRWK